LIGYSKPAWGGTSGRGIVETVSIGESRSRQFLTCREFALAAGLRAFVRSGQQTPQSRTEYAIADCGVVVHEGVWSPCFLDGKMEMAAGRIEPMGAWNAAVGQTS